MNRIFRFIIFVGLILTVVSACTTKKDISKIAESKVDIYQNFSQQIYNPITKTKIKIVEINKNNQQSMVLVHGLGNNASKDWYKLIPELSKKYHLILLDLPGFGGSEYDETQFYTPQLYASLIQWIIEQYAHPEPILMGHSLGGAVSLKFASDYPESLQKLVLVDVAGVLQESVFARYMTQSQSSTKSKNPLKRVLGTIKQKVGIVTDRLIRSGDSWLDAEDILSNPKNREFIFKQRPNANAALGLISEDFSEEIRNIKVPTLILWGEHDPVAPLRTAYILNKHISNSDLEVLDKLGHSPMLDNPRGFSFAVTNWLTGLKINSVITNNNEVKKNAYCDNKANVSYTGQFQKIVIEDCDKVSLKDVEVKELIIKKSIVNLTNVRIKKQFKANNSNLKITNVTAQGGIGFSSIDNQLDIAGSDFYGSDYALSFNGNNVVYWSVSSYIDDKGNKQFLHGREHYKQDVSF